MKLESICERSGISTKDLDLVLADLPSLAPGGPWLAGGCLRRLLIHEDPFGSDLDFFFASTEQADTFESEVKKHAKLVAKTEHARTYKGVFGGREIVLQAVTIGFYGSPAALLDVFDFTVCQLVFDGEQLIAGEHTLWDLGRRHLVVHKISYAVASVKRMLKYQKQGFTICKGSIATLLKQVAERPEVIHAEVEYVD